MHGLSPAATYLFQTRGYTTPGLKDGLRHCEAYAGPEALRLLCPCPGPARYMCFVFCAKDELRETAGACGC